MGGEGVGEVEQGNHMALCWEWEYKNVRLFSMFAAIAVQSGSFFKI
jgi:hypothetical protein